MHAHQLQIFIFITFVFLILAHPSSCSMESFIYIGCTPLKFNPGTLYESNVNSILTSLVNSAPSTHFNNFKISLPGSTQADVIYGLFQCRGDLTNSDCSHCIRDAVTRLGATCPSSLGGALQLEGCFVKYDNVSFLGIEDKTVVMQKCGEIGQSNEYGGTEMVTRRDAVLGFLSSQMEYFRVGGSGKVQGVAQCMQDLSSGECQDCLSEAIGRLKDACGTSPWGDMFLAKCYVRYSEHGFSSKSGKGDDEVERTLAITIGIISGVAVLIVFLSILSRLCERKDGK
ncbi:hypothetical protein Leryth_007700 [Lithospermum erythrorhizon]|nr:hypothetical protein Leryth_007700 [Lithospermum erythrorhizon]